MFEVIIVAVLVSLFHLFALFGLRYWVYRAEKKQKERDAAQKLDTSEREENKP